MRFGDDTGQAVAQAAELALEQWSSRLGLSGLAAARILPGLLAAVDQHAAEVRDAIADRRGRLHRVTLAAYADGVADRAGAKGWIPVEVLTEDWAHASWASLRLLAVCALADSLTADPAVNPTANAA
jgi:hypothetical protein